MVPARLIPFLALAASTAAGAADLEVQLRGPDGRPIRDAVVTVRLADRPTPAPRPGGSYAIDQQNIQFHPFIAVVPVGARVSFLNHDAVRHHVYSFSSPKSFELKLERRQEDRAVTFDKPGIVPLGCNIHDGMIAYVDVVDTPWAAKTDAAGMVQFRGLPGGRVVLAAWHPYLKAAGNRLDREVQLATGPVRRELFSAALRAAPRPPAQSDY